MKLRFFDFEVFPHWWCCTFGDYPDDGILNEDIKEGFVVVRSDKENPRDFMLQQMKEENVVVVGYNIKRYDLIIANGIYQGFDSEHIKILNDIVINPGRAWETKEHMRMQPFVKKKLAGVIYQDLLDDSDGSLKEKEAIFGVNIMESEVPFDKEDLTEDDKLDVIKYNKHDVYATMIVFNKLMKGYVDVKLALGKTFNIPEAECYMCTNAKLVAKALGAKRTSFSDAEKIEIDLPDRIKDYCYSNLPNKIIDTIRTSQSSYSVRLYDNDVVFANGGLHSVYSNDLYVESDDEWILVNMDAASYYPSMMIQLGVLSRAVKDPSVFKNIFDKRIAIKHKKDKTREDEDMQLAYKLVLNTTFGASGNKYLDLYDPYMCTKCCRIGQIFLAALANKLVSNVPSLKVIQGNTDGLLLYFRRKDIDKVQALGDEWSRVSGIQLEYDEVQKIWQRDINNYLLVKTDGKYKRRGAWLIDTWRRPGYFTISPLSNFVSHVAAREWLLNGTDVVRTIVNEQNLDNFIMTCKKGPTYRGVVQRFENGKEVELFKANRVISTKDTSKGMLYKVKMYKGKISYTQMPNAPKHCQTMNEDLSTYDFKDVKKYIDYMYYIQYAMELLDIRWLELKGLKIEPTNRFNYN